MVASTRVLALLPVVPFGLGQGLVFPTVLLWVEELVPADRQGRFSSYVAMAGYIGRFLSTRVVRPRRRTVRNPYGVRCGGGMRRRRARGLQHWIRSTTAHCKDLRGVI